MDKTAINISNIGKEYKIGKRVKYGSLREDFTHLFKNTLNRFVSTKSNGINGENNKRADYFWSLKDISFEVGSGEIIGIIGRNGAGKSTLLKIIAGITEPTVGRIDIHGRIGSLLEVGTGFHLELTGRENIFLNGAILGMRRNEIERKFDEIVAFSDVEKFIDTPVKFYSSGMRVRLGFSVAAHLEPEILLIDEVLAVGDAAFQKKCLGKLDNVASSEGRTVLFVSHDMTAILSLCSRTALLESGKLVSIGPTDEVVQEYLNTTVSNSIIPLESRQDRRGDGRVLISSVTTENADSDKPIVTGCRLKITMKYQSKDQLRHPQVLFKIRDFRTSALILRLDSDMINGLPEILPPEGTISCLTENLYITPGRCVVDATIRRGSITSDAVESAGYFDVETEDVYGTGKIPDRNQAHYIVRYAFSLDEE